MTGRFTVLTFLAMCGLLSKTEQKLTVDLIQVEHRKACFYYSRNKSACSFPVVRNG